MERFCDLGSLLKEEIAACCLDWCGNWVDFIYQRVSRCLGVIAFEVASECWMKILPLLDKLEYDGCNGRFVLLCFALFCFVLFCSALLRGQRFACSVALEFYKHS